MLLCILVEAVEHGKIRRTTLVPMKQQSWPLHDSWRWWKHKKCNNESTMIRSNVSYCSTMTTMMMTTLTMYVCMRLCSRRGHLGPFRLYTQIWRERVQRMTIYLRGRLTLSDFWSLSSAHARSRVDRYVIMIAIVLWTTLTAQSSAGLHALSMAGEDANDAQ